MTINKFLELALTQDYGSSYNFSQYNNRRTNIYSYSFGLSNSLNGFYSRSRCQTWTRYGYTDCLTPTVFYFIHFTYGVTDRVSSVVIFH